MPIVVVENCFQYLRAMGMISRSFDFIVDDYGVYHFLECNEQGNFLFLDQANSKTTTLDILSEALLGKQTFAKDIGLGFHEQYSDIVSEIQKTKNSPLAWRTI
jgi:hypothetical protein